MTNSKNEQGTALIATLLFLMAMGVLSTALVFTVNNEMMTSAAYKYSQQAYYVSSAGVHQAVDWFRSSYTSQAWGAFDLTQMPPKLGGGSVMLAGQEGSYSNYPDGTVAGAFSYRFSSTGDASRVEANEKNIGRFGVNAVLLKRREVHFMNPANFSAPVEGAVERWAIDSMGFWGIGSRSLGTSRVIATIENDGDAFFDRALWGKDLVDMGGTSYVDSFDPTKGSWDILYNRGQMGAIGSNNRIEGSGNTQIFGDVAYGPNGVVDIDPNKVTGDIFHLSEERDFPEIPPFTVGNGTTTLRNDGDILYPGSYGTVTIRADVTIKPGDYFIDQLNVTSQGSMIMEGATNLYINTGFDMQGQATANDPAHPENLSVFFSGGKDAQRPPVLKWAGGTGISASIYAPYATLELTGGTNYSGSFIAYQVKTIGNAEIHFDQGSLNRHLWPRPFRIITWSQNTNLNHF